VYLVVSGKVCDRFYVIINADHDRVHDSKPAPEPQYPAMKPSRAEMSWPLADEDYEDWGKHRRDSGAYSDSCFAPPGSVSLPHSVGSELKH
jgi:hypothetical protein